MATSSFDQQFVVTDKKSADRLRHDVKTAKPRTVSVEKSRANSQKAMALLNRI